MKLETFTYSKGPGWSVAELPPLDSDGTLVLVFGSSSFMDEPGPIGELAAAYPSAHIMGCSTSGEIFDTQVCDETLSVAVCEFEATPLRVAYAEVCDAEASRAAGVSLAEQLDADDLRGVFVLCDGMQVNGSELVRGMNGVLADAVTVTGGLAGDGDRFERTWVLKDGKPTSGWVAALGLYGPNVRIGHGSKGGWDSFGPERRVSRAVGNVLYELDDRPALELYKSYLGERANGLPATALLFPLGLRTNAEDPNSFVRTILSIDEDAQTMTFAGDIPEGYLAQLMRANFDRLIDGAQEAGSLSAHDVAPGSPTLCVAISCVGRRLVLGERTEEEVEATIDVLPDGTQQVGFYSYGEISPHTNGHCDLHNQTMTLTLFSENTAS